MRMCLSIFFIFSFALSGTSQTGGHGETEFVQLELTDPHVSVFVLNETDLSHFRTEGRSTKAVVNHSKHLIKISGAGEVIYKSHRISFSHEGVVIDGKPLQGRNFVLSPNGEVREGFVRTFDRAPHKK